MDTSMWNALFELFPRDLRNKRRPARVRLFATLFVAFVVAGMYFKSRPAAHVYSIWFEPPESSEVHSRCGAFIDATAGRLATPHFLPHVTLLGRIEGNAAQVRERFEILAKTLAPTPVSFLRVTSGASFHQCVYLLAKPTEQLETAHVKAAEAFNLPETMSFVPHLSLAYGDVSEADKMRAVSLAEEVLLSGPGSLVGGWLATEASLWQTDPSDLSCGSWKRVKTLPLNLHGFFS
jgi:2'-5' RNA ligase